MVETTKYYVWNPIETVFHNISTVGCDHMSKFEFKVEINVMSWYCIAGKLEIILLVRKSLIVVQ
jgi:hypothetical protein